MKVQTHHELRTSFQNKHPDRRTNLLSSYLIHRSIILNPSYSHSIGLDASKTDMYTSYLLHRRIHHTRVIKELDASKEIPNHMWTNTVTTGESTHEHIHALCMHAVERALSRCHPLRHTRVQLTFLLAPTSQISSNSGNIANRLQLRLRR